ncbi:MAG: hypothetical protein JWQ90_3747 [Hydrocarboniphaga sp.]|uniref:hypothetical protein n=1 Tax=Hydrocarboniphaga sp. TaxID=2033016 RepID=UPI0026081ABA|nr:hypothetical protein [Hydrocarboniphaga sp.]MDB5971297.1 hypothetical protein [Hydrocarboniphaga sp.]
MSRLLDRVAAVPIGGLLWLDASDYASALLAKGAPPWLDVAATLAWQRKAQGLLHSDVISLPLALVIEAWLAQAAPLRSAMAAKPRLLAPLKVLLADAALRAHLAELVRGMRAGFGDALLALRVPSPRYWPALAYAQAFAADQPLEVSADDADAAAVYVADFLRGFGEAGVDVLLLEECPASVPSSDDDLCCYGAVINVARHYRWDLGLLQPSAGDYDAASLDFVIAPTAQRGATIAALRIPASFWDSGRAAAAPLRYLSLPASGLQPEAVLERLSGLRAG